MNRHTKEGGVAGKTIGMKEKSERAVKEEKVMIQVWMAKRVHGRCGASRDQRDEVW